MNQRDSELKGDTSVHATKTARSPTTPHTHYEGGSVNKCSVRDEQQQRQVKCEVLAEAESTALRSGSRGAPFLEVGVEKLELSNSSTASTNSWLDDEKQSNILS
jgi:hypothetical protein